MPQQQGNRSQATRQMQLNRDAVNEETRTVRLSFASEEPYQRWFGAEILHCDPEAINLQRFNNGLGCLLFNHNRDQVIGHIESVEIQRIRPMQMYGLMRMSSLMSSTKR